MARHVTVAILREDNVSSAQNPWPLLLHVDGICFEYRSFSHLNMRRLCSFAKG
jgi:hypothetical protein